VHLGVGNPYKTRDIATQIDQCVQLDPGLGPAEVGPGEQRQAQIDRGRVEGVHRLLERHAHGLVGVALPSPADQHRGEVGPDAPVPPLVGVRQRAA